MDKIQVIIRGTCKVGNEEKVAKNGAKFHTCMIVNEAGQQIRAAIFKKSLIAKVVPNEKMDFYATISYSPYINFIVRVDHAAPLVKQIYVLPAKEKAETVDKAKTAKAESSELVFTPCTDQKALKHKGEVVKVTPYKGGKSAKIMVATKSTVIELTVKGEELLAVCEKGKHIRFNFAREGKRMTEGLRFRYTLTEAEAA